MTKSLGFSLMQYVLKGNSPNRKDSLPVKHLYIVRVDTSVGLLKVVKKGYGRNVIRAEAVAGAIMPQYWKPIALFSLLGEAS